MRQLFDALGGLFKPDASVAPCHKAAADACRGALKMVRQYERGFFWDASYAAACVDALAADPMAGKVTTADRTSAQPTQHLHTYHHCHHQQQEPASNPF